MKSRKPMQVRCAVGLFYLALSLSLIQPFIVVRHGATARRDRVGDSGGNDRLPDRVRFHRKKLGARNLSRAHRAFAAVVALIPSGPACALPACGDLDRGAVGRARCGVVAGVQRAGEGLVPREAEVEPEPLKYIYLAT